MSNLTTYAPQITPLEQHESSIEKIRSALIEIQTYVRAREPEHDGDALDKVITWRDAVNAGLAQYSLGTPGGSGPGGGEFEPPPLGGLAGWDDLTPPDPLDNLVVTSIPTGFFVEFDAPTYRQGGGNAYSIIYQANYSGSGPLPTFGDAVPVGTVTERNVILVIPAEPGVQGHFWAQPVSFAEDHNHVAPQTSPTGGLNGVYTVAGQLSDDHIADLSAGKITAGQIAVGEYIESTGYDPGVYGWHIGGNGNAEFNNVVVRGTIYATAGLIGGAVIDSDGIESDNYVADTSGWRLDNDTGVIYANDIVLLQGLLTDSTASDADEVTQTWPAADSAWVPDDTSSSGTVGVSHTYNGGTLNIRCDVTLTGRVAASGEAFLFQVELWRKPSSGSGSFTRLRVASQLSKTLTAGSFQRGSASFSLGFIVPPGGLTTGDSYYFGAYVRAARVHDTAGSEIVAGALSELFTSASIELVETKF